MRRPFAVLGLVVALLPGDGRANHDRLPDPPPQTTNQKLPSLPNLGRATVTVSGLSSGAFFAHQFHVAFSSLVKGAGILAGGHCDRGLLAAVQHAAGEASRLRRQCEVVENRWELASGQLPLIL